MMKTLRALETWGSSSGLDGEHPHEATATSDLTARSVTLPRGGQARGEDVTAGRAKTRKRKVHRWAERVGAASVCW